MRTLTRRLEDDASTSPCQGEAILNRSFIANSYSAFRAYSVGPPLPIFVSIFVSS